VEKLNQIDGFLALDITENEMANQHVRFMAGGRSNSVQNEILIRFRLPETPGSVLNLLSSFEPNWNITLFHCNVNID
jgi:threonine dehydratase